MTYEILQTLCALRQQVEAAAAASQQPPLPAQQLVDCNCQTHKLKKTRPIINHRHHHPSRSSTTRKHENQNKAKALYKISLDNIFQVIVRVRVRNHHHHRERERIEVENLEWNLLKLLHFEWQAQCPQFRQLYVVFSIALPPHAAIFGKLGYLSTWSNVIDKVEGDREMAREMKDESGQLICPASFACQVCVLLILDFFRQFFAGQLSAQRLCVDRQLLLTVLVPEWSGFLADSILVRTVH